MTEKKKKNGNRNYNVINVICLVDQIFQNRKCKDTLIKGALGDKNFGIPRSHGLFILHNSEEQHFGYIH